jgi:D-glutamate N-acetyltransferase
MQPLPDFIRVHEEVAALVAPSKVVAVALNTSRISDEAEARAAIASTEAETGIPCDDPVRFGGDALWGRIEAAVDALPWVVPAVGEEVPA